LAKATYIGQLDRRITIETPSASRGASGQEISSWSTFYACWAAIEYPGTRSDEQVEADQEVSTTTVFFIIHYRDGVNAKMRIAYDSKYYDILNVLEMGRKDFLKLPARIHE